VELRHALMATREDLFKKVDDFIANDISRRHLLVLADSGIGKTSFVLNYYAYNDEKSKSRRHQIALVSLGGTSIEEIISQIPNKDDTVIFLDALDEDRKAISDHKERIHDLLELCKDFKKIIITCRTQFFPRGEEIPKETGILKLGPRGAGEKSIYEFWKLYLSPFDDKDIKKYIYKRYPFWMKGKRQKALTIAQKIPMLTVRPMLLSHIPDIIESNIEIIYTYQIYEIMVNSWLEREVAWVDKSSLREFCEKLAVSLYISEQDSEHKGFKYIELAKLAIKWNIALQDWQLGGRSLLNRDSEDYYKFSHRSILEYLFVKKVLIDKLSIYGILLTDQMILFFTEICSSIPHLGNLLSRIDRNMVFNFTHDSDNTIVNSLPEIDWRQIAESKIDNSDNFLTEPKVVFGEKSMSISFDAYLKYRPAIRELSKKGIVFKITDKTSIEDVEQNAFLKQVEKEKKLLELIDIILSIQSINKSGVITIFPNKDLTVLEVIIQSEALKTVLSI
jgi:hypothetical protein